MNLTIRQLRSFSVGARSRTFSAAAAQLGLTQPGFSLLVRQLEEETRLQLFERTTRHIALTSAGRDLLDFVDRTLNQLDEVHEAIEALQDGRRGRLKLAVVPSVACSVLPAILARFGEAFPEVKLELSEDHVGPFVGRVRGGDSEIGIGLQVEDDPHLLFVPVLRDRLVVVVPSGHALCANRAVRWDQLSGHHGISISSQSSIRIYADRAMVQAGVQLVPRFEVLTTSTAVALVRGGAGYTILPSFVLDSLDRAGIRALPLVEPAAWRDIGVLRRRRAELSPGASAFVGIVETVADELTARQPAGRQRLIERVRPAANGLPETPAAPSPRSRARSRG